MKSIEVNEIWAARNLPKRPEKSNKGSFGRLFAYVGSHAYMGAMHLALEAMLRGGAGYVELCAEESLCQSALLKFPELIFRKMPAATEALSDKDISDIAEHQRASQATLIGCGCGKGENLRKLTVALLGESGGTLIIDADAINSLAMDREEALAALRTAKRPIILTPHPLEFSRITGLCVDDIQKDRQAAAEQFARETSSIVLLKGNRTVITDGNETYINTSGSSALAKAGSGDCLAGLLASLSATRLAPSLTLTALAAYVHGSAADGLSDIYSKYGVTPSDLPKAMAKVIQRLSKLYE